MMNVTIPSTYRIVIIDDPSLLVISRDVQLYRVGVWIAVHVLVHIVLQFHTELQKQWINAISVNHD